MINSPQSLSKPAQIVQMPLIMLVEDSLNQRSANGDRPSLVAGAGQLTSSKPIMVIPVPGSQQRYRIVIGVRDFRAAQRAGMQAIPAFVCQSNDECLLYLRSLVGGVERNDVNPVELARAISRIWDESPEIQKQCQLAQAVGKSEAWVSHVLGILDLPTELLDRLWSTKDSISLDSLGRIASLQNRRWQEALIDEVLAGATERSIRARIAQLTGKAKRSQFKAVHEVRYHTKVTIASRLQNLTRQQRREVFADAMALDEKQCDLEEMRDLA